ncbi:LysR family transcriptional regulator [Nonomuraea sp. LPB2021202275-12-8]|uniref:LysR family transcriptional regulator n=1 Tax=Nonomuraea sp. LPB2021202275-12-8 TaxID=3120159 RepID=UPI00300CCE71
MLAELAKRGTIARVAEELRYTPSAVSQQLSQLEREVGVALLERHARRVQLTLAGRVLAEHANRVLEELETAEHAVRDVENLRAGLLRMATFATAANELVPSAMRLFRYKYPHISMTLTEMETELAHEAVLLGDIDLAITYQYSHSPHPEGHGFKQILLGREPMLLAVQRNDSLATPSSVRLADYADAEWVGDMVPEGYYPLTELACRAGGFEPRVPYKAVSYRTVLGLVASGFGVALVPQLAVQREDVIRFLPIEEPRELVREIFVTSRASDANPAVRAMVTLLRQSALSALP